MNDILAEIAQDEILALIVFTFSYLTYFFFQSSRPIKKLAGKLGDTDQIKAYSRHLPRLLGLLLLGILPFGLAVLVFEMQPAEYGMLIPRGEHALLISVCSVAVFSLLCVLRSGKKIDLNVYPQVRVPHWGLKEHLLNALTWSLYLLGYEFMIRGLLFFTNLHAYGLVPAIVINCTIYSLIHIFKGKQEAFGAFFLGVLMCLLAYYTQSIVLPVILHIILAVSNDFKAIKIRSKKLIRSV